MKNSPYKEYVNNLQLRLIESGLKRNHERQMIDFIRALYPPSEHQFDPDQCQVLRLHQMMDVFRLHVVAMLISLLVFVGELVVERYF